MSGILKLTANIDKISVCFSSLEELKTLVALAKKYPMEIYLYGILPLDLINLKVLLVKHAGDLLLEFWQIPGTNYINVFAKHGSNEAPSLRDLPMKKVSVDKFFSLLRNA